MSLSTMQSTRAGAQACANRPALHGRQPLANRIDLDNICPAGKKLTCDVLQFRQRYQRLFKQGTAPAGEQKHDRILRTEIAHKRKRRPRSPAGAFIRNGMPTLKACNARQRSPLWPYFVMTTPRRMRPSRQDTAAWAICHAALPAATRYTPPVPKS